jgi:hypothetical protein
LNDTEENQDTMKSLVFVLIAGIIITSCSSSKEASTAKLEKKAAEKEVVKRAVESRRYVIRMDRILMQGGGIADLIPKSNFFIMNGEIASVSLAYLGKSYFIRQITGINFNGQTIRYEMQSDAEKGVYNIQAEIETGGNKFDFYLTIGASGNCSISLNNPHIQSVSYLGTLVPLSQTLQPSAVQKDRL